tara:strand:+ start:1672 stop:2529 length:858 start_codon:yes stop_codon:yes gene_type:complete
MGIFSNPWQGIDRFIRHPVDEITHPFGHHDQWRHFKNDVKDAGMLAAQAGLALATDGGSLAAQFGTATVKNWASTGVRSLSGSVKKQMKREAKSVANVTRRRIRKSQHYSGKVQENSAMVGENRRKAQIPERAKRVYESRYFEVYRDPQTGETYLWGKPTLSVKAIKKDPMSFAREWIENKKRLDPKYRKSDPLYRDMAKIKQEFGNVDHISGYSRGGAAAQYQSAKDSKSSRIFGPYVPVGGIGDHRARRSRKFDPVHVVARGITKYNKYARPILKAYKYGRRL